jgi:hypothetical protein
MGHTSPSWRVIDQAIVVKTAGTKSLLPSLQKGGIPLFGKEGLGEISGKAYLVNYGLLSNASMGIPIFGRDDSTLPFFRLF